jgi:hypothetical protein
VLAASTRWAREWSHRAGVYVAGGTAGVLGVIDEVICDVDVGV